MILLLAGELEARVEPKFPRAIISLSPNVTEILYGVGAFDRVVAVSSSCEYPPQAKDLPKVGGWQNTSLERVASLEPDLVIMTDAQAPFVQDHLQALGIRSLVVGSQSLDDVFSSIAEIGRAVGRVAEGERLAEHVRGELEDVRRRTAGLPRPRVLSAAADLRLRHRGQVVAIVTHGGVNRVLLRDALEMPKASIFRLDQSYAALSLVDYYEHAPVVRFFNVELDKFDHRPEC